MQAHLLLVPLLSHLVNTPPRVHSGEREHIKLHGPRGANMAAGKFVMIISQNHF